MRPPPEYLRSYGFYALSFGLNLGFVVGGAARGWTAGQVVLNAFACGVAAALALARWARGS